MANFLPINRIPRLATITTMIIVIQLMMPTLVSAYSTDYVTVVVWSEGGHYWDSSPLYAKPSQMWNVTIVKEGFVSDLYQLLNSKDLHIYDVFFIINDHPQWNRTDLGNNITQIMANVPGQSVLIMIGHGGPSNYIAYKYDGYFGYFTTFPYRPIPDEWANSDHRTLVNATDVKSLIESKPLYELPNSVILVMCHSMGYTVSFDNLYAPDNNSWAYAFRFLPSSNIYTLYGREIVGFLTNINIRYDIFGLAYDARGPDFIRSFIQYHYIDDLPLSTAYAMALQETQYNGFAVYLTSLYYGTVEGYSYNYAQYDTVFANEYAAVVGFYGNHVDPYPTDAIVSNVLEEIKGIEPNTYYAIISSGIKPKIDIKDSKYDIVGPSGDVLHLYSIIWSSHGEGPVDVGALAYADDSASHVYLISLNVNYLSRSISSRVDEIFSSLNQAVNSSLKAVEMLGLSYVKQGNEYDIMYEGFPVYVASPGPDPLMNPRRVMIDLKITTVPGSVLGFSLYNTASILNGLSALNEVRPKITSEDSLKIAGLVSRDANVTLAWVVKGSDMIPIYVIKTPKEVIGVDAVNGSIIHDRGESTLVGGLGGEDRSAAQSGRLLWLALVSAGVAVAFVTLVIAMKRRR